MPKLSANAITAHLAATFAGLPVYVHTIEHADGVVLVDTGMLDSTPELDGEAEVLPGIRLLPTPGHTDGHQSVLVDTPDGLVVIGGDVAYTYDELGSGATEGQRRVLALAAPTWLTHAEGGPKVPRPN